jgi:hypothetical protein
MQRISKGSPVRLWFAGAWRDTVAVRQIPGGIWQCKLAQPVGKSTMALATRAALRGEE